MFVNKLLLCTLLIIVFLISEARELKRVLLVERCINHVMDPEYGQLDVKLHKFNGKVFSLDIMFVVKKTLPADAMFWGNIDRFSDNIYKKTTLQYKRKLCDYLRKEGQDLLHLSDSPQFKNFVNKCPVVPGNYTTLGLQTDNLTIPNYAPLWKCRMNFGICMSSGHVIVNETAYFSIDEI